MSERDERAILKEISQKLDLLTGAVISQGLETEERLRVLTALELPSRQIATLADVTPGYVRAWQSRQRRKAKG